MAKDELYEIPGQCPVSGDPLFISELTATHSGVRIKGKFRIPTAAQLDADQQAFLETFLRARGVISTMEKELGISYPTVRARIDALLESLSLSPYKEREAKVEPTAEAKRKILKQLEEGKITAEQAKAKLRGVESK